jgi:hypothetical protein
MRVINILLAAYITFVACGPCNDNDVCVDDKGKGSVELAISRHEHTPEEIDLCSPFCTCNCCRSTINQPKYFNFTFHALQLHDVNVRVKPSAVKTISHSIWQPPRLA